MKTLLAIFFLFVFVSCTNSISPSVTQNHSPEMIATPFFSNIKSCGPTSTECKHAYIYNPDISCASGLNCKLSPKEKETCKKNDCIHSDKYHYHIRQIK